MKIPITLTILLYLLTDTKQALLTKKTSSSPKESKKLQVNIDENGHVNILTNQEVTNVKVESQNVKKKKTPNYTIHQVLQETGDEFHKILHPEEIHVITNPDTFANYEKRFKSEYKDALERDKKGEKIPVETKVLQNVIKSLKEYEAKEIHHNEQKELEKNDSSIADAFALKLKEEMAKAKRIEDIKRIIDELTERLEELMESKKTDETLDEIDDISDKLEELKDRIVLIKNNDEEMPTDELGIQIRKLEDLLKNRVKEMKRMEEEIGDLQGILDLGEKLTAEEKERFQQLKVDIMLLQEKINHLVEEIENLTKLREEKMERDKLDKEIKALEELKEHETDEEKEVTEEKAEKLLSEEQEDAKDIEIETEIENLDNKIDEIEKTEENLDTADPETEPILKNLEDTIKALEEEESPLKEEVDEKQLEMEKFEKGIDLKNRLNIRLNPMLHNIAPVLDKEFADTSDFDEIGDGKEYGYKNLNAISADLNGIEETMTRLFKDLPSAKALPSPDKDFDEGIFIVETVKNFLVEFKVERKIISTQFDGMKNEMDTLLPSLSELLNFYNIKEEYDESIPLTKDTPNKLILESYEKIKLQIEDFDENVVEIKENLEKLEKHIISFKEISNDVSNELFSKTQGEDINEDKKYSAQNMKKIQMAIKTVPDLYDIKFDFDENLFRVSSAVSNLKALKGKLREYIDTIYREIKLDLKRVYDEDGNLVEGLGVLGIMLFGVIAFF